MLQECLHFACFPEIGSLFSFLVLNSNLSISAIFVNHQISITGLWMTVAHPYHAYFCQIPLEIENLQQIFFTIVCCSEGFLGGLLKEFTASLLSN